VKQMQRIERIINLFKLPCRLDREADDTLLHVYSRNDEMDSSHERPDLLITIRDSQLPNGGQPHPRLETVGRAYLVRITLNETNTTRCDRAGIHPGSLRPGSLPPK
jgi:hypothetical protein